jgi:creatinine amidohydrolase
MLALDPGAVRMADARPGRTEPLAELLPELRDKGVRAVSGNGVLGDPGGANPEEGRRLLQVAADRLVDEVVGWWSRR